MEHCGYDGFLLILGYLIFGVCWCFLILGMLVLFEYAHQAF
ncbi:hypothetical protein HanPI659440_Chr00c07g0718551 [Helianthus annuus]|nr:hypothetical protein HanPI659440_Chr00c07g0718551 [Helianthus annuus]